MIFYNEEEISEIKNRLNLIVGEFLMTEDESFCIMTKYNINEKIITEGFFKKKKTKVYYISLVEISFGKNKNVKYTDGILCTDLGVQQLIYMKEAATNVFNNLKKFEYSIHKIE